MKVTNLLKCLLPLWVAGEMYATNPPTSSMDKPMNSPAFVFEQDKEWDPAGDNVVRQILGYDKQVMLVKVKFLKKGAIGSAHTHPHVQTTYVASGKFEFTVGDEKKIVEAGDGIYIAPNVLHGCVCLKPGTLIDCFAPMREDFLK